MEDVFTRESFAAFSMFHSPLSAGSNYLIIFLILAYYCLGSLYCIEDIFLFFLILIYQNNNQVSLFHPAGLS